MAGRRRSAVPFTSALPELPIDLLQHVLAHSSVFGLYDCRRVCAVWLTAASRARDAKGVLTIVGSSGGKLGQDKSIHPCVRGKSKFPVSGLCGFGDGFLLAADDSRHRLMKTTDTAELIVYDRSGGDGQIETGSPFWSPFALPVSVLHCRLNDRDVIYAIDAHGVHRLYAAELDMANQPTARSEWATCPVDALSTHPGNFLECMTIMSAEDFTPRPPTRFGFFEDLRTGYQQYSSPLGLSLDAGANELVFCDRNLNGANRVHVVDATSLAHKRSFVIVSDGSAANVTRAIPTGVLVHGGEVFVMTLIGIDVYTRHGVFLRHYLRALKLRPDAPDSLSPCSAAVYPVDGVDHLLVASKQHVHVLTLPDAAPRQIIPIPGALCLHTVCVHQGRVYVSDRTGGRIHTLQPIAS
jgi:hypothetical protein